MHSSPRIRPRPTSLTLRYEAALSIGATANVGVQTNTTQALAGPTVQDSKATYFAGATSLVQLTNNGAVYFLPYAEGQDSTNAAATWSRVSNLASVAPPSTSTGSSAATSAAASGTNGSSPSGSNGAMALSNIHLELILGVVLGAVACLL